MGQPAAPCHRYGLHPKRYNRIKSLRRYTQLPPEQETLFSSLKPAARFQGLQGTVSVSGVSMQWSIITKFMTYDMILLLCLSLIWLLLMNRAFSPAPCNLKQLPLKAWSSLSLIRMRYILGACFTFTWKHSHWNPVLLLKWTRCLELFVNIIWTQLMNLLYA